MIASSAGLIVKGERNRGLLSRWYPETLAKRIELIHSFRAQIEFYEADAMEQLPSILNCRNTSPKIFVDPPYPKLMRAGVRPLYTHVALNHDNLVRMLAESNKDFLLTYDDTAYARNLVTGNGLLFEVIAMKNTNAESKKELLIFSDRNRTNL